MRLSSLPRRLIHAARSSTESKNPSFARANNRLIFILNVFPAWVMAQDNAIQVVVEPTMEYFIVEGFSEGLAAVEDDGKCGFIDETGSLVIPLIYDADRFSYFSEGLALVYKGGHYIPASQRIREGGKCGFIDKTGKVVVPLEYDYATPFSEGVAIVEKDAKQYIIDTGGNIVTALDTYYDDFSIFSEGLAWVSKEGSDDYGEGFIDKTGKEVIPLGKYSYLREYSSDGLACAYNREGYGYIDKTGEIAIPFEYGMILIGGAS